MKPGTSQYFASLAAMTDTLNVGAIAALAQGADFDSSPSDAYEKNLAAAIRSGALKIDSTTFAVDGSVSLVHAKDLLAWIQSAHGLILRDTPAHKWSALHANTPGETKRPMTSNEAATAVAGELAAEAQQFIADQAKHGITVSPQSAVQFAASKRRSG